MSLFGSCFVTGSVLALANRGRRPAAASANAGKDNRPLADLRRAFLGKEVFGEALLEVRCDAWIAGRGARSRSAVTMAVCATMLATAPATGRGAFALPEAIRTLNTVVP